MIDKGLASVGICALGALCMYWNKGNMGIGWAILGLFIIWA